MTPTSPSPPPFGSCLKGGFTRGNCSSQGTGGLYDWSITHMRSNYLTIPIYEQWRRDDLCFPLKNNESNCQLWLYHLHFYREWWNFSCNWRGHSFPHQSLRQISEGYFCVWYRKLYEEGGEFAQANEIARSGNLWRFLIVLFIRRMHQTVSPSL